MGVRALGTSITTNMTNMKKKKNYKIRSIRESSPNTPFLANLSATSLVDEQHIEIQPYFLKKDSISFT